ncbi:diguanylate cyclase [Acidovorax sp. BL-A-41-H1]|uniref:GGDEF domain-containing protein n=1 Tax=Acidovorax sp. BL-A-41-H1 TaxID=3421102 RepID=UPI003F7A7934
MQLHRMLQLLGAVVLVATMALVGRMATTEWQAVSSASDSLRLLEPLRAGLVAMEMVSRERGPTNAALGDAMPMTQVRSDALQQARLRTDRALIALRDAVAAGSPGMPAEMPQRVEAATVALAQARTVVDQTLTLPGARRSAERIRSAVYAMVAVVPLLAPVNTALAGGAQQAYPALGDDVQGALLAADLREYAGLLGSHFTAALVKGEPFSPAEHRAIDETRGRIAQLRFLIELRVRGGDRPASVLQAWETVEARYFGTAQTLLESVLREGDTGGRYGLTAADFAARYVPDMNPVLELRDALLLQAREGAMREHDRAVQVLLWALLGAAVLLAALGSALYVLQRRVLRPLVRATGALHALADREHKAEAAPQPPAPQDEVAAVIGAVRLLQQQTRRRHELERERDRLIEQLREQSATDYLTGLRNRRSFIAAAHDMLLQAQRYGFDVAMVLLDIDWFKQLNDSHGHAAGDRALQAVAQVLRTELRETDLAGRFGGEEFVVMLSHCDPEAALQFALRLREAISDLEVPGAEGQWVRMTASLGVANSRSVGLALEALLSAADKAMYSAKNAGRDQVAESQLVTL